VDYRDTFLTTFNSLALLRRIGARRFAFASSSAVYGERPVRCAKHRGRCCYLQLRRMKLASEATVSAATSDALERAWIFRFRM